MRRRFVAPLCVLLIGGDMVGAQAQGSAPPGPDACASFDWPVLREQAWFAAPGLPRLASGATLPAEMPGATLDLSMDAQARLPLTPSREPKPETRGGVLHVPAPVMPGLYQITLSENAWIDVSQDGTTTRPPVATTMRPGCPGVVKSLRFQFGTQPVMIVISGAQVDAIHRSGAHGVKDALPGGADIPRRPRIRQDPKAESRLRNQPPSDPGAVIPRSTRPAEMD